MICGDGHGKDPAAMAATVVASLGRLVRAISEALPATHIFVGTKAANSGGQGGPLGPLGLTMP